MCTDLPNSTVAAKVDVSDHVIAWCKHNGFPFTSSTAGIKDFTTYFSFYDLAYNPSFTFRYTVENIDVGSENVICVQLTLFVKERDESFVVATIVDGKKVTIDYNNTTVPVDVDLDLSLGKQMIEALRLYCGLALNCEQETTKLVVDAVKGESRQIRALYDGLESLTKCFQI